MSDPMMRQANDRIAAIEAELKAANERADAAFEMAAKVCDAQDYGDNGEWNAAAETCSQAIRALQSSDAAKVVEDAERYQVARNHIAPRDLAIWLKMPCADVPPDADIASRVDDLIDAAIDQARKDAARKL